MRRKGCPACWLWRRNCTIATTSSRANGIMSNIRAALARHNVHHAPTLIGWRITRMMLVIPRGTTANPKIATIHGMVRHRRASPITVDRISTKYTSAPNPASLTGHHWDTSLVNTRWLPSPKNGSNTQSVWPSWYAVM